MPWRPLSAGSLPVFGAPLACRQPRLALPAAGLQVGLPEGPSAGPEAHKGTSSRCQALRAADGSGLISANSRNPAERSAAALVREAPSAPLGLPDR